MKRLSMNQGSLVILALFIFLGCFPLQALDFKLCWLPQGKLNYQAFSARPDRLPQYSNDKVYKSFLVEASWNPYQKHWGLDFRAIQAGRTAAQERIGDYQTSPMILSIQHWELLAEVELADSQRNFLTALSGVGTVTDQWERTKHVIANGVDVDSEIGLSEVGTPASGLRTSVENISVPLGMRWKWNGPRRFFTETLFTYSFLMDFTDVLTGSSPFSGWATHWRFIIGRSINSRFDIFAGYLDYTNHVAAPAGQGGLRLRGGTLAPEGVYVLFQENEIRLSSALVGIGFRF